MRFEVAGQTALISDSIGAVFADLGRVSLAIMAVTLILLVLFLRSLLVPVHLLAASVLAAFATLGPALLSAFPPDASPGRAVRPPRHSAASAFGRLGM